MASYNFVKEMGKKTLLASHLERWFNAGEFPDEIEFSIYPNKAKDDAFHPSSDATPCARTLYAKHMGDLPQRSFDATSYKTFFFGHYFHGLVQYVVVEELGFARWPDVERERTYRRSRAGREGLLGGSIPPKDRSVVLWWARGMTDIARCSIPGRGDYLIDIKTMNANTFKQNTVPADMLHKYRMQVQLYLDWNDMEDGIILFAEKDSPHRFKEVVVRRDRNDVEEIYARWDSVAAAMKMGEPPDCDICMDKCPTEGLYVAA